MSLSVRVGIGPRTAAIVVVALLLLLAGIPIGRCQLPGDDGDGSTTSDDAISQYISVMLYNRLQNISEPLSEEMGNRLNYCILDRKKDWNEAFNFSSNLTFLSECYKKNDDLGQRICTAAEIKFYFNGLYGSGRSGSFLKPNINCNLKSWVSGCEPGWACSSDDKNLNLKNSTHIPGRESNCQACCEGFFCPRGITCMMPCPLGSYCPRGELNNVTGLCSPYNYQLPPGKENHTCGGADIWADINTDSDIFCPAGYYCPTTTKKLPCEPGHYCRLGSTSMQRCYKKSSCKAMTANQDITLFGLLLIAALGLLLLIIYNFSDQILTSRERQQAKSREAAARSARETAQARERWKSAKDIARKHALGFQSQLSRTFSRKTSVRQAETLKGGGQNKLGDGDTPMWSVAASSSSEIRQDVGPSNFNKAIISHGDSSDNDEAYNLENGDKHLKKKFRKDKPKHTRSQIFKYAYGQIEKEKALQQGNNMTFSGVIAMATNTAIRKRHEIEVDFINLNITLKGKRKTLMRCVTGKLMPGRMTAVMGPSGAGKTTFLNALTGKITGCEMSGSILVNGKAESLRSYKKIIGFVPQDDIVHGNLTVEENLWFSAKCRLSADMPKADKVLVLERVIESLGLQAIRDSLVGTVEKRGISGGQRKRVNVGLEMVMEPSLLILDEPTSGLDSSSSQLLLRALRRETVERVNIVLVVHQPSYSLFQMFDDLILLAKGGLIAYHGPVKKVEQYFSGLGIHVPDRVNPPDHYIDILEGIVKPSTSSGINYKQLPVKWMQHNGYEIPPDMLHDLAEVENSNTIGNSSNGTGNCVPGSEVESVAGEVWGDIKCAVEQKKDHVHNNYRKSKDLSNRKTAGILRQYRYFLGRVVKQRLREARIQFVDFLILLLAGVCLGTLAKVSDESFGAVGYTYTVIAVSLLCKIGALRSFSLDKLHYWRESASGMSSLAYFLAKDTIDHFNTLIKPIVYLSMFYFFNNPRSSITDNYVILLALVYCVTGVAYSFAIFLQPGSAQLWSVLLPVVLTLIATQKRSGIVQFLANFCYPKWALQAFVISNAQRYSGVWLISRCGALQKNGYDIDEWRLCIVVLFVYGLVFRIMAYFFLITFKKR